MKNKLNLSPGDAKRIHDEFYEPERLLSEQGEIPKWKRPERPTKAVKGKSTKPYLSTGKIIPQ